MQKKLIYIFLAVLVVIIIGVVVGDILSSRPDKRGDNPFALKVDVMSNRSRVRTADQPKMDACH